MTSRSNPRRGPSVVFVTVVLALLAALLGAGGRAAQAQQTGSNWRGLIPGLKTRIAQRPDPETSYRLAMVYAHEGMLIDGWHVLKQSTAWWAANPDDRPWNAGLSSSPRPTCRRAPKTCWQGIPWPSPHGS